MVNVSVIVPIYNVKQYLAECLDSLTAQTCPDCEFICIDDGSTDNSFEVVEAYKNNDSRLKLIRQSNGGLAEARNTGIRNAHGKYISFLDADDFFTDEHVLDMLYQKAEENHLDLISFETELLYEGALKEQHNKDFYYYKKFYYGGIRSGQSFFVEMMDHHEYCDSACLLFVQREWLMKQGIMFYPGIFYEDALFSTQCFLLAERMMHLSKRLYTYRIREKSIMTTAARWENVHSRVVIYRELLRLLITMEPADTRLQKAMSNYLSLTAFSAKYLDDFRVDEQPDKDLDPLDDLFLKTMGLGHYRVEVNEGVILRGLEKLAADSVGLILYGAGKAGQLFYHFLKAQGLSNKVMCYAVSGKPRAETSAEGVPVLSIEEAARIYRQETKIILSVVDQQAQKEMKEQLKQLGVCHFELFDQYIYRALRHYGKKYEATGEICQ